jgi:hypothetical protein
VSQEIARENSASERRNALLAVAYGQVAAMLGAFSLLVFLGHFMDVGLEGLVADAVEEWQTHVRPILSYPFQALINLLPESVRFELSPLAQDYLSVGVVSAASFLRMRRLTGIRDTEPIWLYPAAIIGLVLLWPYFAGLSLLGALLPGTEQRGSLLHLAPLFYLAVLFVANALLA